MVAVPRWFPLDMTHTVTGTGFIIDLDTDVPCHLFLFYTFNEPWTHRVTRNDRGLLVPWYTYWCYNTWIIVEQDSAGDTVHHKFHINGLVTCNHIWFRFHGTIAGVSSPSDSPIFHLHYVKPDIPEPEILSYCIGAGDWPATCYMTVGYGSGFKSLKGGTTTALKIRLGKYGTTTQMTIRFYPLGDPIHFPSGAHLWETIVDTTAVPIWPLVDDVLFPVPEAVIEKDLWYGYVCRETTGISGNGYVTMYTAVGRQPPNTGRLKVQPFWTFVNWDANRNPWFELWGIPD